MKICARCKEDKDENKFGKNSNKKDGLQNYCKECRKEYYKNNIEKKKAYDKEYYINNKDNKDEQNKKYFRENRNKINEWHNNWKRNRYKENPEIRIKEIVSVQIRMALRSRGLSKNKSSCVDFLPYTIHQLIHHIESLWEPWMNWENYGLYDKNKRTWQIDHKIPHSKFHYNTMDCEEFRNCWSLTNLQPLEAMENIKKKNK